MKVRAAANQFPVLLGGIPEEREGLVREQAKRLRRVVESSARRVPYYRRLFAEAGITSAQIQSVEDLRRLPPTSKRQLLELLRSEIVAEGVNVECLICRRTSGSSGEPFSVLTTWTEDRVLAIRRMRPLFGWGWRPWEALARIKIQNADTRPPAFVGLLKRAGLLKLAQIDSLAPVDRVLEELEALRPHVITGYPAVLATLALSAGKRFAGQLPLRFLVAGGSTMTELMKAQIEEGFGAPVKEIYASHEFNLIASQCPVSEWLHVADDSVVVEVVDGNRPVQPGEIGDVLVTGLLSFAQPFIRYRLDDRVELGPTPCPCGAPYSTLRRVVGRLQDWIVLKDGTLRNPDWLFSRLAAQGIWIRQFQLVQPNTEDLVLGIVPLRAPTSEERSAAERLLAEFSEGQLLGRVELHEQLPTDPNGKFRVSKSRVQPFYR